MSDNEQNETEGQMKQRHKRELQAHQKKTKQLLASFKKPQKKEKRIAKEECEKEELAIKQRHKEELAALTGSDGAPEKEGNEQDAVQQVMNMMQRTEIKQDKPQKMTKAQKRRAKRKAEEERRRKEAEEEAKNMPDYRDTENKQISSQLDQIGLSVSEIRSDGHCLYRALGEQLDLVGADVPVEKPCIVGLRKLAAQHIRCHADDFIPFLTDDNGDMLTPDGLAQYCDDIVSGDPVVWGGHPEIVALAAALGVKVLVYSANGSPLEVGNGDKVLRISYHEHYFGLGQHYNSVVPKN